MCSEWFEKGLELGRNEVAQKLASWEQRSQQDKKEAEAREEKLCKQEKLLSHWQRKLAAQQELSQVKEEVAKKQTKVINGLKAQLCVQAGGTEKQCGCVCKPPAAN